MRVVKTIACIRRQSIKGPILELTDIKRTILPFIAVFIVRDDQLPECQLPVGAVDQIHTEMIVSAVFQNHLGVNGGFAGAGKGIFTAGNVGAGLRLRFLRAVGYLCRKLCLGRNSGRAGAQHLDHLNGHIILAPVQQGNDIVVIHVPRAAAAAGGKHETQDQGQKQADGFFHLSLPPVPGRPDMCMYNDVIIQDSPPLFNAISPE